MACYRVANRWRRKSFRSRQKTKMHDMLVRNETMGTNQKDESRPVVETKTRSSSRFEECGTLSRETRFSELAHKPSANRNMLKQKETSISKSKFISLKELNTI
jgi:hypothetical protein